MSIYNQLRLRTRKVLPRRFHCYCIGAAKTGTTSISSMFKAHFDSAHEPAISETNHQIINYLKNEMTDEEVQSFIEKRDRKLNLEMESTHSLIYIAKEITDLFPDAKYLITVREPLSWIRSRINFHFKKHPPEWEEYRQYFWMDKTRGYDPEEAVLEANQLASLDAYLSQYNEHYLLAKQHLPEAASLYIRTDNLSREAGEIARFLNINARHINTSHANSEPEKASFIEGIDEHYLTRKVWGHCENLIREYFPERVPFYLDEIQ